jgi:thymidylate kinase
LFEGKEQQRKVGENYRELAKGPLGASANTVVVDGDRAPEAVHAEISKIVGSLLRTGKALSRNKGVASS